MAVGRGALSVSFLLYRNIVGVHGLLRAGSTQPKASPESSIAVLIPQTPLPIPLLWEGKTGATFLAVLQRLA